MDEHRQLGKGRLRTGLRDHAELAEEPQPSIEARGPAILALKAWGHDVAFPFFVTRAALVLIAWLCVHLLGYRNTTQGAWEIGPNGSMAAVDTSRTFTTDYVLLNAFARWDSGWYYSVARNGYQFQPGQQSNAAFFPLFPVLMRAVHALTPGQSDASWFLAGIIVSNGALLVALTYLLRLVRREFDVETARRSVWYTLILPTTLFYSAVYSESLFLCCAVAAMYYGRVGSWWWSGAFAAGAALTRSPGIVLMVPLAYEYLAQRQFRWRLIRPNVLAVALPGFAILGLSLFMYIKLGNAMAVKDAQFAWGARMQQQMWPWNALLAYVSGPVTVHGPNSILDLSVTLIWGAGTVAAAFHLPAMYSIYSATMLFFLTAWGSLGSMCRYVLIIYPVVIVFALLGRKRWFEQLFMVQSFALASFFMVLFVRWLWVG